MRRAVLILSLLLAGCAETAQPEPLPTRVFVVTPSAGDAAAVLVAERTGGRVVPVARRAGATRRASAAVLAELVDAHAGPSEVVALPGAAAAVLQAWPAIGRKPGRLVLIDPPTVGGRPLPAGFAVGGVADGVVVVELYRETPEIDGAVAVERLSGDAALVGEVALLALAGTLPERPVLARGDGPMWRLTAARDGDGDQWIRLKAGDATIDVTDDDQRLHLTLAPGQTLEVTPHRERTLLPDEALTSRSVTLTAERPAAAVNDEQYDVRLSWEQVTPVAGELE